VHVEWIILADYAELSNNKLYLMGGGWESLTINTGFPTAYPCAIAVAFVVPWEETNRSHNIDVSITSLDGAEILATASGQLEVGRPPGIPHGHDQRVQSVIKIALGLQRAGVYLAKARTEQDEREVRFIVIEGPNLEHVAPPTMKQEA